MKQGLYARFPNGRILSCMVEEETCLDDAATLIEAGATLVSLTLYMDPQEPSSWPMVNEDGSFSGNWWHGCIHTVCDVWSYQRPKRSRSKSAA